MARILIVDDEKSIRQTLGAFLRREGYEVVETEDADVALQRLSEGEFDVVVTDIILPRVTGVELLRRIRAIAPDVQVVMMTGEPTVETASESLRAGAADYLFKPITKEAILHAAANAVRIKTLDDTRRRLEAENHAYQENLEQLVEQRTAQLRASEERAAEFARFNQAALDALTANICVLAEDGTILAVNEPWRLFAIANPPLPANAGVGANYLAVCEAVRGEDAATAREAVRGLRSVARGDVPEFSLEYPCHSPATQRWFRLRATRFAGAGPARIVVAHTNITVRKQAVEALRESERRYQTLAETSPAGVFRTDPSGQTIYVNARWCELAGLSFDEALGEGWLRAIHPEDREALVRDWMEARKAGRSAEADYRLLRPDGSVTWVLGRAMPDRDAAGRLVGYVGTLTDITERKQAEVTLRESEDRYRSLVEDSPNAIGIYQEGKIAFINSTGARQLGAKTKEELLGREGEQIIHPDDRAVSADRIRRRLAGETDVYPAEARYVRLDGTIVPVEIAATPITFGGKPAMQFIARDISVRKRAEARLNCFARLGHVLSTATDPQQAAQIMAEAASDLLGWDASYLTLGSLEGGNVTSLIHLDTINGQRVAVPMPEPASRPTPMFRRVLTEGAQLVLRERPEEAGPQLEPMGDLTRRSLSLMFVPVRREGKPIGVFSVQSYRPRAYGPRDLETLQALADHGAGALLRLQVEAELARNHELYRRAITAANAIPYQKDYASDTYVFMGEGIKDLTGYAPSELRSAVWKEMILETVFLGEAAGLTLAEAARRVLVGQLQNWRADHRIRTRSGETRWISDSSIPLLDADGKYAGSLGILQDITERKRAEEQLRAITERLHFATAAAKAGVWDWNLQTNEMIWDDRMRELYGLTHENFPGGVEVWKQGLHPDDSSRAIEECEAALRGERGFDTEFRILRPDGTVVHLKADGLVLRDEKGKLLRMIGLNVDITERKQTQEALRESERQFRAVLETMSLIGVMLDRTGQITLCNDFLLALTGWNRAEVMNQNWFELFLPPEIRGQVEQEVFLKSNATGEVPVHCENEIVTRAGARRLIVWNNTALRDHAGSVVGVASIGEDITERKRAERVTTRFAQLGRDLSSATEAQQAARIIADAAQELLGWDCGFLELRSEDLRRFDHILHWDTIAGKCVEVPTINDAAEPTASEQRARSEGAFLILREPGEPPALPTVPFGNTARRSESLLYVPLCYQGSYLGLFSIQSYQPHAYTHADLELLQVLADHCAGALERIRAQAALRESEERFRGVYENALMGLYRTTPDGRILLANPALVRMLGYSSFEELSRQNLETRGYHPDYPRATFKDAVAQDGILHGLESAWTRADGTTVFVRESAQTIRDAQGNILYYDGVVEDITERKRAQADYAMLFEKMLDGFALHEMIFDAAGRPVDYRFLAVNPGFEHMTGLPAKTVLGRTMLEIAPKTESFWIETYGQVVMTGKPEFFEHFSRELDRHFEVSAFRPAPGQFACVIVDISGRKHAEMEILRHQVQLQAIYDNAPLMMCLVNEQREVEQMNRAMAELSGPPPPEGAPRHPGDFLGCLHALDDPAGCGSGPHCGTCPLRLAMLETFRTGRAKSRVETTLHLARQGVRRELRLSASTALMRIAGEAKVLLCLEDITARKQLEQQFLQAQKMEAVGQLAGGVAHDFNNILAAIIMHLHLLQETPGLAAEVAGALKDVQGYAHRAADLTRQLLLFSRRKAVEPKRVDLNAVIEGMMKMLRRVLGEHIEMKFAAAPEGQWVDADPGMIEQVVMNLCVNARDAMPKGGHLALATATVEIGPEQAQREADARVGRFVCLTLGDTGCGMNEATLKRLFEPFFTTKEVGKGTGLGLATVYGIVSQHQGWVSVESSVGAGTTFRVYLPRTAAPETSFTKAEASVMPRGHETILLVEDESSLLTLSATILRRCGYRVLEARSGIEALRVWEETGQQAHLVLTDMVMPGGISGFELVERLRQLKPGLKVLLTSGYSLELARQDPETRARFRFLAKPYQAATLAKAVREVLDEK